MIFAFFVCFQQEIKMTDPPANHFSQVVLSFCTVHCDTTTTILGRCLQYNTYLNIKRRKYKTNYTTNNYFLLSDFLFLFYLKRGFIFFARLLRRG